MIARFWSYLTALNLARPRSSDSTAGGEPATPGMWLERADTGPGRHRAPR